MKGDILGLLGICRKAGKLKMGFDAVAASLERDARLLLITDDISPKTRERILSKAANSGTKHICLSVTSSDVEMAIGKKLAVMAITDAGFASAAIKKAGSLPENTEAAAASPSTGKATTTRRNLI